MKSNIDFSFERFKRVRERFEGWWMGTNQTPIVGATIRGRNPRTPKCDVPYLTQASVDLETPVEKIVDAIEYELSSYEYLGDAFPFYNMDSFGPGVLAAMLGADLDNQTGRVWFHPKEHIDIDKLNFTFDRDSAWFKRIVSLYKAANERFDGLVRFGMVDLGGILDVLSTFFPGDELLLLLYDDPENVKRLAAQLCKVWHEVYDALAEAAEFKKFGYTDWSGIYSEKPSYVIQCDFSYMIGSDMFKEFALDSLKYTCTHLDRTIYHLDGINELQHLDDLIGIRELNAIQWVPGTNQKLIDEWPEVFRKIIKGGKRAQVLAHGYSRFMNILKDFDCPDQFLYQYNYAPLPEECREEAICCMKKLHVEI